MTMLVMNLEKLLQLICGLYDFCLAIVASRNRALRVRNLGPPEKGQIHCGAMDVSSFLS